ncbi:hypothetical protein [Nonomuraea sediminis]|uniref:hypothetical protein n=1 Tax=Nonomuraea sediminis TaxID=2835864 RepID=UPI001BDCCE02|nr:hypothetical protein [Nonomuraea sediminis]
MTRSLQSGGSQAWASRQRGELSLAQARRNFARLGAPATRHLDHVRARDNLLARITEAEREGWTAEAEGLQISLAAAEAELAQVDGLIARRDAVVDLGMPTYRDLAQAITLSRSSA